MRLLTAEALEGEDTPRADGSALSHSPAGPTASLMTAAELWLNDLQAPVERVQSHTVKVEVWFI